MGPPNLDIVSKTRLFFVDHLISNPTAAVKFRDDTNHIRRGPKSQGIHPRRNDLSEREVESLALSTDFRRTLRIFRAGETRRREYGAGQKMAGVVVVFDFDCTIIDGDSDRLVVTEMGLTDIFNQLRSTLSWNSLMDRMMKELHSQGKTVNDIAECLRRAVLHTQIAAAIKSAHAHGCDLRIVSDANQFFIEKILDHHGLLGCFSSIYTNPTFVDQEGRLRILPYHDPSLPPHGCPRCQTNMCKGKVLDHIHASIPESRGQRFIYLGDGGGDFCPTLKLRASDFVMPRKNYSLWYRIRSDPLLIKAQVHEWSNGVELERILLHLITKMSPDWDNSNPSNSSGSESLLVSPSE